jgi:hypothetical protein
VAKGLEKNLEYLYNNPDKSVRHTQTFKLIAQSAGVLQPDFAPPQHNVINIDRIAVLNAALLEGSSQATPVVDEVIERAIEQGSIRKVGPSITPVKKEKE